MAQTKSRSKKASSRSSGNSRSKSTSSRSNSTRSTANSSRSRNSNSRSSAPRASSRRSSTSRSNRSQSSTGPVARATGTVTQGVKDAGSTLADVSKKAKVPALAAGAGLAGLAGGVALAGRNSRKRVLGIAMPTKSGTQAVSKNLAEAANNVGRFGEGMGSLAAELRTVREGIAEGGAEKRRSPIEVVLQGLTSRR
jgi:hypothetical protein